MKKFLYIIFILLIFQITLYAADVTKTIIFAWDQDSKDFDLLTRWEILWSKTSGGPYELLGYIPYDPTDPTKITFQSPFEMVITGKRATHEKRYFVLSACGNIPQEDETVKYLCSNYSNEVESQFWIPFEGFKTPITFKVEGK